MASVRDGGTVLVYGFLSGTDFSVSALDVGFGRHVHVRAWSLARQFKDTEGLHRLGHVVVTLLQKKVFTPSVGPSFELENFQEAMKLSDESRGYRGPRVLLVG